MAVTEAMLASSGILSRRTHMHCTKMPVSLQDGKCCVVVHTLYMYACHT